MIDFSAIPKKYNIPRFAIIIQINNLIGDIFPLLRFIIGFQN